MDTRFKNLMLDIFDETDPDMILHTVAEAKQYARDRDVKIKDALFQDKGNQKILYRPNKMNTLTNRYGFYLNTRLQNQDSVQIHFWLLQYIANHPSDISLLQYEVINDPEVFDGEDALRVELHGSDHAEEYLFDKISEYISVDRPAPPKKTPTPPKMKVALPKPKKKVDPFDQPKKTILDSIASWFL